MAHRPDLIVIGRRTAGLRVTATGGIGAQHEDVSELTELFEPDEHRFEALHPDTEHDTLSRHFRVLAPEERYVDLAEQLAAHPAIDAAYVKPGASLPIAEPDHVLLDLQHPDVGPPPDLTPDYVSRQGYLDAPPVGVGALDAWALAGGRGQGVRIIDCEFGWNFTHEDLQQYKEGVIHGTSTTKGPWIQHGTAVLGTFGGDPSDLGVTGICPEATASATAFGRSSPPTVRWAADQLRSGDLLLIELERNLDNGSGQFPFTPVEWWPDDFAAIQYAVAKGVIVVEPGGNGGANLDDAIFDQPQKGFPASWVNPFRSGGPDSGAIMVGAGSPPAGTHGRSEVLGRSPEAGETYVDRARCGFSNYGTRMDAQGWGREVTSTGFGSLKPWHQDHNRWYVDMFNGTSSASPVVVGALACVQGVLRAKGMKPLTPQGARDLLRRTGSPQQGAPGRPETQRIGNRPDIGAMLEAAGAL